MLSSCLQYAVPVWAHAASNLSKLDKVQNNATKIAKKPKRSTPVKLMKFETG